MKDNTNKYFDNISKIVIQEGSIESPSFDFTDSVMSQVLELNSSYTTVYKPLISKKVWFVILIALMSLIIYIAFFNGQSEGVTWMSQIDFGMFSKNGMTNLLSFNVSKTFTYAIVLLGIMVGVQVIFLKNHFNQRFQF